MVIDENDNEMKVKVLKTRMAMCGLGKPIVTLSNPNLKFDDFNQRLDLKFYTEWAPNDDNITEVEYNGDATPNVFKVAYKLYNTPFPFYALPIHPTRYGVSKVSFSSMTIYNIAKMKKISFEVLNTKYHEWQKNLMNQKIPVKSYRFDDMGVIVGFDYNDAFEISTDEDYLWLYDLLQSKILIDRISIWISAKFNEVTGLSVIMKNIFTEPRVSYSNSNKAGPYPAPADPSSYFDGRRSSFWKIDTIDNISEDALIDYDLFTSNMNS